MISLPEMDRFLTALKYASRKHRLQRRKDGSAPYINHLIDVAMILWQQGAVRDPALLTAALLHDVLEDTDATQGELEDQFGCEVLDLVLEVSDDKGLTKQRRKELVVTGASGLSEKGKQLLLADKAANMKDLLRALPKGWSRKRKDAYFEWCARIYDEIEPINEGLQVEFLSLLKKGLREELGNGTG